MWQAAAAEFVQWFMDTSCEDYTRSMTAAHPGHFLIQVLPDGKRHLLVDQDGLFVDLLVTPADVQDRDAARILLTRLHAEHPEIVLVWADNGYGGEEFSTWAQDTLGITIKVVPRPKDARGFVLLPKRWVVERSNSWTMRARRNARD